MSRSLLGSVYTGIVTLATFTCQPREAVIGRRQENQWLGELQRGTGPFQNPLFLANVTMPFQTLIAAEDRLYVAADGTIYAFTF